MYDDESSLDRWETIANMFPGVNAAEAQTHYERLDHDVFAIENGLVPLPNYDLSAQSSTLSFNEDLATGWRTSQPSGRDVRHSNSMGPGQVVGRKAAAGSASKTTNGTHRKGIPWSEEEHRLFLKGLEKYGQSNWRMISRLVVQSRTPTQVASHAQKYSKHLKSLKSTTRKNRKRPSIHDTTPVDDGDSLHQCPGRPITGPPCPEDVNAPLQVTGRGPSTGLPSPAIGIPFPADVNSPLEVVGFYPSWTANMDTQWGDETLNMECQETSLEPGREESLQHVFPVQHGFQACLQHEVPSQHGVSLRKVNSQGQGAALQSENIEQEEEGPQTGIPSLNGDIEWIWEEAPLNTENSKWEEEVTQPVIPSLIANDEWEIAFLEPWEMYVNEAGLKSREMLETSLLFESLLAL